MTERWDAMAVLADGGRRALFEYVQHAAHAVTREEAADALGISRGLAAFHLDKLVDAGMLHTRYEAPLPRGRGRAPKVYEAVATEVVMSIPDREYALVAQILADAVADDPAHDDVAVQRHARRHGYEIGRRLAGLGLERALADIGFQPSRVGDERISLTNCPFHALAVSQTALICGLNVAFVTGMIEGVGGGDCRARLNPSPGRCCVEITTGD